MHKGQGSRSPGRLEIFLGKSGGKAGSFIITATVVVALDQLSKWWIRANPQPVQLLPGILDLVYGQNPGAVFGLPVNTTFLITIIIAFLIIIVLVLVRYMSLVTILTSVSAGLIFGGAIGNLIDRFRFSGCVTDFIDLHLQNIFHWYTFNLADTAVTVGIFILIYSLHVSGLFRTAYEHGHNSKD
jgi:signal peptidase II